MPPVNTFLVKNRALEPVTAHALLSGMTSHMARAANQILTNKVAHPAGTDPQFNALAINILRLSNDIETFLRKKGDLGGEKRP